VPRATVTIDLTSRPVYEAGAEFLSWVANPDENRERRLFSMALRRSLVMHDASAYPDHGHLIRADIFGDGERAARAFQKGFVSLNKRLIAAHRYVAPFLRQEGSERPLRVDNLAQAAIDDLQNLSAIFEGKIKWRWEEAKDAPIANIKSRVFGASRAVLHAAFILEWLAQIEAKFDPDLDGARGGRLLREPWLLRGVVERSEEVRSLLIGLKRTDGRARFPDDDTIRFLV